MARQYEGRWWSTDFDKGKIYIYLCGDGVTRQRCGQHVEQKIRALTPVRIWKVVMPGRKSCIECKGVRQERIPHVEDDTDVVVGSY